MLQSCFNILFIIIFINYNIVVVKSQIGADTISCRTPDGKDGSCVILRECAPLWTALTQRQRLINNIPAVEYLRRSQCGFEGNSPVVCCASQAAAAESSTPKTSTGNFGSIDATLNHRNIGLLPTECGHQALTSYVVGGTAAQLGEHPWLAGLEYRNQFGVAIICGGALISESYVLTAAHCLRKDLNSRLSVRLGEHDQSTDPDCSKSRGGDVCAPPVQQIPIEQFIIHPQYRESNPNKHFDIALLRLRKKAKISDYVRPLCLPTEFQLQKQDASVKNIISGSLAGSQQTVVGWGRTESNSKSDIKLRVSLPVLENTRCFQMFGGRVKLDATQMCAGAQAGKDSCNGDSGGPLMANRGNQWVVTGVVSVGPQNCGTRGIPGIYTRVTPFLPWILDNLSNSSTECNMTLGGLQEPGDCRDIRTCDPAIALLREKPRRNTTIEVLLAARCGEQQSNIVYICCPIISDTDNTSVKPPDKNAAVNNRVTGNNSTTNSSTDGIKTFLLGEEEPENVTVASETSTMKITEVTSQRINVTETINSSSELNNVTMTTFGLTDSDVKLVDEFITILDKALDDQNLTISSTTPKS